MVNYQLKIDNVRGGIVLGVKVVPGSSRTAIAGVWDGKLKVKVAAPPEKGKANQCLIDFLAKQLGVKKNAVAIIHGQTSPIKQVHVSGLSAEAAISTLYGKN